MTEEAESLPLETHAEMRVEPPVPWSSREMAGAYEELEHPADLFMEIRGRNLEDLFENALYAFYSEVAVLETAPGSESVVLVVNGASAEEALRALLAEALFHFDTDGFVAAGARVKVNLGGEANGVRAEARLWGDSRLQRPGSLLTEVKAVTYHRLAVSQGPDGYWRATVLFDV